MADAFISYSRKDKAFATALKARLEADGFEILFDLEDILASEDWARRLVDMIAGADHFVFMITPDSCQSRVCSVEINTALDLSKNIVPVTLRQTATEAIPPAISTRQWIDALSNTDPAQCAEALGVIFKTSPAWLRQHTELTSRARDWHLAQRRSALLRGSDLSRAEQWLSVSEGKEPPPSRLQTDYIEKSRRWRRTSRSIAACLLGLAVVSAAIAWKVIDEERRLSADSKLVSIASDWIDRDPTKAALVLLEVTNPEQTPYARARLAQLVTRPIASCELPGHSGGVRHAVFSPSGEFLMTLAGDRAVRLWRSAECQTKPAREIRLPDGIDRAMFTASGNAIVVFGVRSDASLWSVDGKQIGTPLEGEFKSAWLTRTGDLVTLRKDFAVEVWGTEPALERKATFVPFANLPGYGAIERAEFSETGDRLVLRTHGGVTAAWTLGSPGDATLIPGGHLLALSPDGRSYARSVFAEQRGREYRRYYDVLVRPSSPTVTDGTGGEPEPEDLREADHNDLIDAAAFSPDGNFLVTASGAGAVQVSDLREPTERRVARLEGHTGKVRGVQVAAVGDRFVTFGDDRTARLWRFGRLSPESLLRGHVGPGTTAAFSPDGGTLVTGGEDGVARLWHLDPGNEPLFLKAGDTVTDAWFTPDNRFVVARSRDSLEAWRLGSGSPSTRIDDPAFEIKALARHPREPAVALASIEGDIVIKSLEPGSEPRLVGKHVDVNLIAFDDSGVRLVSASGDGKLRMWNLEAGGDPLTLEIPRDTAMEELSKKLSADPNNEKLQEEAILTALLQQARGTFDRLEISTKTGRILASGATSVYSWPIDGGKPAVLVNPGDKLVEATAFDPKGAYVATAHAWDYTVRLWRADGSGLARTLGAATKSIRALRFSPDGKHLIVASEDETVRIWPIDRDDAPIVLRGHTSWVVDAEFSHDSTRVVTASYDGTARLWNVDGSDEEVGTEPGELRCAIRFDQLADCDRKRRRPSSCLVA